MAQERREMEGAGKTGGQRSPQLMANTRTAETSQSKQTVHKSRDVLRSRVAWRRIDNDLYERQSS